MKMLEVLANYVATRKRGKNGKTYESPRIYLPTKLTCDSGFPMPGKLVRVRVRVVGGRLLIEKASRKDLERFGELPAKRANRMKRRKRRSHALRVGECNTARTANPCQVAFAVDLPCPYASR